MPEHTPRASRSRPFVTLLVWAALSLILVAIVRAFVASPHTVVSASMAPGLLPGDVLLVERLTYFKRPPRRGDIVVVAPEGLDAQPSIKRLIGLPGDLVEQRGRVLVVNGVELPLVFLAEVWLGADGTPVRRARFLSDAESWREGSPGHARIVLYARGDEREDGAWQVPEGHVFLVGDNRDLSLDSRNRAVGPVSASRIAGRVVRIVVSKGPEGWRSERFFSPVR